MHVSHLSINTCASVLRDELYDSVSVRMKGFTHVYV